ncbi:MAG: ribonuclease HII, partial [Pseudomonadota bacterium]
WRIAWADPREIDRLNILQASLLAMRRAVRALRPLPDHVIVDGNRCPVLGDAPLTVEAIVGGDRLVPAVSAASILAKEFRDAWMLRYHARYPKYGFDRHKGYPTRQHLERLEAHGPCPIHRYTFGPVKRCAPPPRGGR